VSLDLILGKARTGRASAGGSALPPYETNRYADSALQQSLIRLPVMRRVMLFGDSFDVCRRAMHLPERQRRLTLTHFQKQGGSGCGSRGNP